MKLTEENKKYIDGLSLTDLLRKWRYAKPGDEMMQGETGDYWGKIMFALRDKDISAWVAASKSVGWN